MMNDVRKQKQSGYKHMKITVEIDDNLTEEEITIHCRELNDEVISLQKRISEAIQSKMMLNVTKGELEYYLNLPEILFFETADSIVAVHTKGQIFETRMKLYELEELLPASAMIWLSAHSRRLWLHSSARTSVCRALPTP